jgi:GAF domain-containing protein
VLWPACVAAIAVWLMRTAAQDGDAGRRRLLVRIGWLAIAISASGTVLGVTGSGHLVWIPALLLLALLVELMVLTARHERLWGLPSLLHRTVLWLALATVLALVYAGAVGVAAAFGWGLDGAPRWIAIAAAIGVAAVARSSLDGLGRRALVGEGADPGRAVLGLVRRVEAVTDVREAPQVVVDGVARAVHAAHASLDVVADGRLVPAAEAGSAVPGDRLAIPVVHAGVTVGVLAVTVPRGERLGDPEQALVRDLGARAAPAIDAFRLTRQLEDDRTRRAAALAEARAGAEGLLRGRLLSRLDAIAAELRAVDLLETERRSSALVGIDQEVARMLHSTRALAHDLASPRA